MSTRRVSQVITNVEAQSEVLRLSQLFAQAEASSPTLRVTQEIVGVEVSIPTKDATPEWVTGFEHGVGSTNGGGLFDTFQAGCSIVSTTTHSGTYACRVNTTSSTSYFDKQVSSAATQVVRFYVYIATKASIDNADIFRAVGSTNDGVFGYKSSTNKFYVVQAGGTIVESDITVNTGQWYCIDLRLKWGGTTHTIDWKINNVSQTSYSLAGQSAETFSRNRFGVLTNNATADYYFDDIVTSPTNQDYPIGPGGTVALVPNADGTHNQGTVIKDQAGNTINGTSVTAYNKLNSIPISDSSSYVKQTGTGTGNYAEVQFTDMSSAVINRGIIGVMAVLAYTAADPNANTGGAIIFQNGSTSNIWGASGALQDYSDGSTAGPYYKSVLVSNANNVHKVNDLRARIGYSNDVTPNPYWLNVIVEVAYVWTSEGTAFSRNLAMNRNAPFSVVLDDFNRANGAIGTSRWNGGGSTPAISSNKVHATTVENVNRVWAAKQFGKNQEVFVTWRGHNAAHSDTSFSLVLKSQQSDPNSFSTWLLIRYVPQGNIADCLYWNSGSFNYVGSVVGVSFADGDKLSGRVINGRAVMYKNGVAVASWSVSGFSAVDSAGWVGFRYNIGQSGDYVDFDDFGGGDIDAAIESYAETSGSGRAQALVLSQADGTTGASGPVEVDGDGHTWTIGIAQANGYVTSPGDGSSFAIALSETSAAVSTSRDGTITAFAAGYGDASIETIGEGSSVAVVSSQGESFTETNGDGACDAIISAEAESICETVGDGYAFVLTSTDVDSACEVSGEAFGLVRLHSQQTSSVEMDAEGNGLFLARSMVGSSVSTEADGELQAMLLHSSSATALVPGSAYVETIAQTSAEVSIYVNGQAVGRQFTGLRGTGLIDVSGSARATSLWRSTVTSRVTILAETDGITAFATEGNGHETRPAEQVDTYLLLTSLSPYLETDPLEITGILALAKSPVIVTEATQTGILVQSESPTITVEDV